MVPIWAVGRIPAPPAWNNPGVGRIRLTCTTGPTKHEPMKHLTILIASFLALALGAPAGAQKSKGFENPFASPVPVETVVVSAKIDKPALAPSDQAVIAVVLDFAPTWHAWPAAPRTDASGEPIEEDVLAPELADFAVRTEISLLDPPEWIRAIGETQYPEVKLAPVPDILNGGTVDAPVYKDRAIAFIPVQLADDVPAGGQSLTVLVSYQACDDTTCQQPQMVERSVDIRLVESLDEAAAENAGNDPGPDFAEFDVRAFATLAPPAAESDSDEGLATPVPGSSSGGVATARPSFFGVEIPEFTGPTGLLLAALFSMIGGFILNLTPCVLPVIPIKVMTISQHAGSPGRSLVLGLWMAAGVIAFWVGIGLPVAFISSFADPSMLFGIWWVTLGIGVLIGVMGIGIMGLFTINLPQSVYMVNPKADSAGGSFMFGVMTAVLGLPCFGFVAGALLAGSATMPVGMILTIFAGLGVGMAAPYLVLAAKPSLVEKIPRTGPASDLVKQVMGLLLLAAAAFFIGSGLVALVADQPWMGKQIHWWAVAVFASIAGLWLLVRTFQITSKPVARVAFSLVSLVVAGVAVAYAWDSTEAAKANYQEIAANQQLIAAGGPISTRAWLPYDDRLLQRARDEGKTVVIDFTADWCLNCKALKATVLERQPVKDQLLADDTVALTADLTSQRAPGWDKLRNLGQTGIPLLVIYGPALDDPWRANAYTPDQVMEAISAARGG